MKILYSHLIASPVSFTKYFLLFINSFKRNNNNLITEMLCYHDSWNGIKITRILLLTKQKALFIFESLLINIPHLSLIISERNCILLNNNFSKCNNFLKQVTNYCFDVSVMLFLQVLDGLAERIFSNDIQYSFEFRSAKTCSCALNAEQTNNVIIFSSEMGQSR